MPLPTIGQDPWGQDLLDFLKAVPRNVKDFGAVGDGVTDDTAAIQAAIDDVFADGGGVVYFPTSQYKVTSLQAKSGVWLIGEFMHVGSANLGAVLSGTNGQDIITFPTTGGYSHFGFRMLTFKGGRRQIVSPQLTTYVWIEHCHFYAPQEDAIGITAGSIEEWYISDCWFQAGKYCIRHQNVTYQSLNYIDKSHFTRCAFSAATESLVSLLCNVGNSVIFDSCIFTTSQKHGIVIDGGFRDIILRGCNWEGNGKAGKKNRTTLSGTVSAGATSATLASATGWATGDGMCIQGAGANGVDFYILSTAQGGPGVTVSGTTVSWTGGTSTTVVNPRVTNAEYDDLHINNTIGNSARIIVEGGKPGAEGSDGRLRYAIHFKGGTGLDLIGLDHQGGADRPVYDPSFNVFVWGGNALIRRPPRFAGEVFVWEEGRRFVSKVTNGSPITVTSIRGNLAGTQLTVIGTDANTTFDDASTLKLNSDWVSAVDSTLQLIGDGTNWYEIARTP
jgi:hypothetical protein